MSIGAYRSSPIPSIYNPTSTHPLDSKTQNNIESRNTISEYPSQSQLQASIPNATIITLGEQPGYL